MLHIAILGKGQLGSYLYNELTKNYFNKCFTCIFDYNDGFDITNYNFLKIIFEKYDIIINCAALTNVDLCEEDNQLSYNINTKAVMNMMDLSNIYNKFLIHISSDYVYGSNDISEILTEDFCCNPINFYGQHKLEADNYILNNGNNNFLILRPSWVFGKINPNNFIEKILNNLKNNSSIKVVDDQFGVPTSVDLLYKVICQYIFEKDIPSDLYNIRNESNDITSRYDIAKLIKKLIKSDCKIIKCKTKEFILPAERQLNSFLDISKIKKYLNFEIDLIDNIIEKKYKN